VRAAIDWALVNDAALGVALFGSAWPLFVETDLSTGASKLPPRGRRSMRPESWKTRRGRREY
jgi:hypothetical protein